MKQDNLNDIATLLAGMRRTDEIRDWLTALLTPRERERLFRRWQLVRLLADGMPQREIARRLGLSLCNITRGSRELKRGPESFRKTVAASLRAQEKSRSKAKST